MTVKPPLSVAIIRRCSEVAAASFRNGGYPIYSPDEGAMSDVERERWETLITAVEAVIREAGFCDLVAALKAAREFAVGVIDVEGSCYGDPLAQIDAALKQAGEAP